MFTLLSEQHKKLLYRQYRTRLLCVIFIFISGLFLSSIALLLPSYLALTTEDARLQSDIKSFLEQISEKNSKGLVTTLNEIKSIVALISPEDTKMYSVLKVILGKKPAGISITSIDYARNDGAPSSLSFQGVAASRSALIQFSKTLQSEKMFSSVSLPVSNLAKESDIKYSLTVSGDF